MAKQADFDPTTARPVEIPKPERRLIEQAINEHLNAAERMILQLDRADGDTDLEEGGDAEPDADGEASFGWSASTDQNKAIHQARVFAGAVDVEDEHDGCEPDVDDEPSLGSLGSNGWPADQRGWGGHGHLGYDADLEDDAGDWAEDGADDDLSCEDIGGCEQGAV